MASHDVNLGIGNYSESGITGMFYHAPEGTALPTDLRSELAVAWKEVGAISEDGISFNPNWSFEKLKNWAKQIERTTPSDESPTVSAPIIETTEESFKTVFGADNVTATAATSTAGNTISVNVTEKLMPPAEAYLFLMKDDDDIIMVGTTKGFITELAEVAFQPDQPITWNVTITASEWTFLKDDGQTA